jgi:hypothetical protein
MKIVIATLIVLAAIASALAQDYSVFSWAYWQEGGTASRSEIVRNLGLLAAGVIGLGFGIWRAYTAYRQTQASQRQAEAANEQAEAANEQAEAANEQARIAQQGQITDRFSTAVEHLGSEQLPVRLGGIYALWRLISDSHERDVISVIDILCAFVRDPPHPPVDRPEPDTHEGGPAAAKHEANATDKLRLDVQTILDLIGDRDAPYLARLPVGHFFDLAGANLMDANLTEANLADANLADADLSCADLSGADLSGADLGLAILTGARLATVNLRDAILFEANLTNANLIFSNLTNANLTHADLTNANFSLVILTNANLRGADLSLANNLTQDQLDSACVSEAGPPPALPEGLKPPKKLCVQWIRGSRRGSRGSPG